MSLWYLHPARILKELDEEARAALAKAGRLKRWGHRAEIPRDPENGHVSLIMRGSVDWEESGHHLRILKGDLFGEMGTTPNGVLRAYDDALICEIPRDDFLEITEGRLPSRKTSLGLRARSLELETQSLLFTTPEDRFARVIALLAERYGKTSGIGVDLPSLKERHLAELMGLSKSHTQGILTAWRDAKYIELGRARLWIPDLQTILDVTEKKL